ncbi:MAG TPA: hypothetical protein VFT82_02340, partial [Candidatus Paceibacterota bacterium]|nr:hypothetical protein [Candidatus Paceibacterota bacterium]
RRALAEIRSFTEDLHLSSAGALGSVERREAVKTALVQFDTMLGLMIDRINESIDSTEARRSRLAAQPPTGEVVYHINLDEASKMVVAQLEYDGAELCQIKSALRKVRTGIQEDVKKL